MTTRVYLLRHGESRDGVLTEVGKREARCATWCFKNDWDRKSVAVWHAPNGKPCYDTAIIFAGITGIPVGWNERLHSKYCDDLNTQREFAEIVHKLDVSNVVIIGRDENRSHIETIVRKEFHVATIVPSVPEGGLLRYTARVGYMLIA